MSSEEAATEDVVAKYKKLLSLARSSLESNQATIAAKDKQIHQLIAALEEEKANRLKRVSTQGRDDENITMPRNLLRRVDVGQSIWILIEYEGIDDSWKEFTSEQNLDDFITRTPGAPLIKPPRSLSPTESRQIEEESKKKIDLITEEFRRYKVRTEIVRKQKDVETKQALSHGNSLSPPPPPILDSSSLDFSNADDLRRYKAQLQEQESKWRTAFERAMKENEQLRTRGSEALIIAQLREQYESCLREKNELQEKVKIYEKVLHDAPSSSGSKSLEQSYIELRDEYKEFRRRVQAIDTQRQIEEDLKGSLLLQQRSNGSELSSPTRDRTDYTNGSSRLSPFPSDSHKERSSVGGSATASASPSDVSNQWSGTSNGLIESKVKYIRQMVFQYLSCREPEVKLHIESALMAIFRFNDHERLAIDDRKKEESQDTLTSITNFLGTFGTT